jgi:hypothetical protein
MRAQSLNKNFDTDLNFFNKYKLRPTEPVLTNYVKTKEIDAYVERLAMYKNKQPDNIIFRNKNLQKDLKIEFEKRDETSASNTFHQNPNDVGKTYFTMSPYTPTRARDPPKNFAPIAVRTLKM